MSDPYDDDPQEAPPPAADEWFAPAPVDCWRCGKSFAADLAVCPYCRAKSTTAAKPAASPYAITAPRSDSYRNNPFVPDPTSPVVKLIGFFAAYLLFSIIFAMILRGKFKDVEEWSDADRAWALEAMLVMEAVDTILVCVTWAALGRPEVTFRRQSPLAAWLAGLPVLALLLGLNFTYHWVITWMVPSLDDPEKMLPNREWMYLVGYCLQPAVVEELFFRGLALEWFRTVMTTRAAVVVSGAMFALCHIYAPVSLPYLFTVGIVFGILRVVSGGLLLPMVLHFLHNFIVTLFEHYRA